MTADAILIHAIHFALGLMLLAMLLTSLRVVIGPTLADRVLALDQLVAIAIGFIALIAIRTGFSLYIDIALALGLVGFLATASFARYLFVSSGESEASAQDPAQEQGEIR